MKIFKFEEIERERLIEFQDQHNINRIPLHESVSLNGETLYLEQDGAILGIVSIVKNSFHPTFDNLYFAIANRNSEVMLTLYESLIQKRAVEAPPLQIMYEESEMQEQKTFLDKYGFSFTLTCECPQIDVERSLDSLSERYIPVELRLLKYSQLNCIEKVALREFRLNGYVETHFWSPPIHINDELWLGTDLDSEAEEISWVVFKGDRPILCSDAHINENDIWLGWGWHSDELEVHELVNQVWSKILSLQLSYCKRFGKRLFGEFDSLDKYGQYKSKLLVHLTKDTKYIFQQKKEKD